jgi:phytoene synthase
VSREIDEAYAYCLRLAREHYENFPVASWLLPARMRPHIAAIYAFARVADDFADEPGLAAAERLRRLDDWECRLHGSGAARCGAGPPGSDLIFRALGRTVESCALPIGLLEDLLSAFRQDVTTSRYDTWADVLDYCRRSANPVGRLVLRVAGYRDGRLDPSADALCTALQLTNFWQDLARDFGSGRIYVPRDDRERAGAGEAALEQGRFTPEWRAVMREMGGRTRALFAAGRAVCDGVSGRLRWELRLTWLGGARILARLERAGYDVFTRRPSLGAADALPLLGAAIAWRPGPRPVRGGPAG